MEIDERLLAIAFGLGIIGVVGMLVSLLVNWLRSSPAPKNNRFMGREFHNED